MPVDPRSVNPYYHTPHFNVVLPENYNLREYLLNDKMNCISGEQAKKFVRCKVEKFL